MEQLRNDANRMLRVYDSAKELKEKLDEYFHNIKIEHGIIIGYKYEDKCLEFKVFVDPEKATESAAKMVNDLAIQKYEFEIVEFKESNKEYVITYKREW